jgi:hypothetical protein
MIHISIFILNGGAPASFWPHDLLSFLDSLSTWMAALRIVVKVVGAFSER